jgi:hypothetical protein
MPTKGPKAQLIAMLVGASLGLLALLALFRSSSTNFDDAALNAQTKSIFSQADGHQIHCRDKRDLQACVSGSQARSAANVVIWLGNSQIHAVNQPRGGDTNAPPLLFERLLPLGRDLLTFSQPNASLQEHYVLFEYLRLQVPVKSLILSVVFDDMRETGLRPEIAQLLEDAELRRVLAETEIGSAIQLTTAQSTSVDPDLAGVAGTVQERSEKFLTGLLSEHWELWKVRPEARGQFFLWLYQARNTVFGIKPTSKRRMIAAPYRANFAALEAMLESSAGLGIEVLLYVAPLRPGIEPPYVPSEYTKFKSDLQALATRYHARFANLEELVPENLWGKKDSTTVGAEAEIDFMHFQAEGHRLLADHLFQLLTTKGKGR